MPWSTIEADVSESSTYNVNIQHENCRELAYTAAIREGLQEALTIDPRVFIMGQDVDAPTAMFGTTLDLHKEFGSERSFDTPLSETGLTGVAMGAALGGLRPVYFHNRPDFLMLGMDSIVNHASKWSYMFKGQVSVPLVLWCCIGRGWGSAAQHSQSLHGLFMHIPGLKVIMPSTCYDAKGLLLAAIKDNNPVLIIEHRLNFKQKGMVPIGAYTIPIGKGVVRREGKDVTVVAISHLVNESSVVANELAMDNIDVEVIDPRTVSPLDTDMIIKSVEKTGRLVIADTDWLNCGPTAEIAAQVYKKLFNKLKAPIERIAAPNLPVPSGFSLEQEYFIGAKDIKEAILRTLSYE